MDDPLSAYYSSARSFVSLLPLTVSTRPMREFDSVADEPVPALWALLCLVLRLMELT